MTLISGGSGSGGSSLPYIKYTATDGKWTTYDREPDTNGVWGQTEEELDYDDNPRFVFDFPMAQIGWLRFGKGMPPHMVLVDAGSALPPRPTTTHNQGFRMLVMGKDKVARELASNTGAVITAFNKLHDAYEAAPEAATGKVPLVELVGATKLPKNSYGSQPYQPDLKIVGWTKRPKAFADAGKRASDAGSGAADEAAPVKSRREQLNDEVPWLDDDDATAGTVSERSALPPRKPAQRRAGHDLATLEDSDIPF